MGVDYLMAYDGDDGDDDFYLITFNFIPLHFPIPLTPLALISQNPSLLINETY
jgi:hypothetical protein